jgi:hypothetical protein
MHAVQAKLFAFEPNSKAQEIIHTQTMAQFFEMLEVRRAGSKGSCHDRY